jgi:hypothetical protein
MEAKRAHARAGGRLQVQEAENGKRQAQWDSTCIANNHRATGLVIHHSHF